MLLDFGMRNARAEEIGQVVDIGVSGGRIAAMQPGLVCQAVARHPANGRLAFSGFVDSHVHLDKACSDNAAPVTPAPTLAPETVLGCCYQPCSSVLV